MAEIMEGKNYNGRATAGLTLGIIGTALAGLVNGNGFNLFGGNNHSDERVDFLQMELAREKSERYADQKFCDLKSEMYNKFDSVNSTLCAQATWNATNTSTISCLTNQINQLTSLLTYGIASDKVISSSTSTT